MAKKRRNAATAIEIKPVNILATILAEIAGAVELLRPHFPADAEDTLRRRAEAWRPKRYASGRWPDFAEVAKAEAAEADAAEAAAKAAGQFDPRVQSAACHKKVRHYPIHRISEWRPPSVSADQSKRQSNPRSPK
jgi:hypothetical protein